MHPANQPTTNQGPNPLRKLREALGFDLAEMALLMDCTYQAWWRAERTCGTIPPAATAALAELGIDTDALQAELNSWKAVLREELKERLREKADADAA